MKHLYFLQGYLHKTAGISQSVLRALGKKLPSKSTAFTAGAAGLAAGSAKSGYDTARAQSDASISDIAVKDGKENLRKAQNPHNWTDEQKAAKRTRDAAKPQAVNK